jgi:hypothetical protein
MQIHNAPLFGPNNAKSLADDALAHEGVVALRLFDSENDVQRRLFNAWWWELNHYRYNVSDPHEAGAALVIIRTIFLSEQDEFGVLLDVRSFPDFECVQTKVQEAIALWRKAGEPCVFNDESFH